MANGQSSRVFRIVKMFVESPTSNLEWAWSLKRARSLLSGPQSVRSLILPILDLPALLVGLGVILVGMIANLYRSAFAGDWAIW
jgi:hypothetical protein